MTGKPITTWPYHYCHPDVLRKLVVYKETCFYSIGALKAAKQPIPKKCMIPHAATNFDATRMARGEDTVDDAQQEWHSYSYSWFNVLGTS